MKAWPLALLFAAPLATLGNAGPVLAHGGGLAADGCHYDRKAGTRHCHRGSSAAPASPPQRSSGSSTYFPNCAAARAAGAAPVRRGDPGYGRHLDRDNDGIGCE